MITITVGMPEKAEDRVKLIETLTKEKGYKLIEINQNSKTMLFEINKNFEETDTTSGRPMLLLD